ncbi:uncharacterized protein EV154DRAFT_489913 [Mucor mucedo]|uniref:uncharacterized protein n=1 Tax=Mucor mucedo TaxID=29922 RepID=UPI002220A06D|nr:uncharacterized protein EV154DRAFT_489913 [Mucor mucedo]KAI7897415.1 hypothetical protein EV154DRAFT_489913 [Mucor mucedo]
MSDKYKNLKVKELQELLQKSGLPHSGKKEELIERLVKHEQTVDEFASLDDEFGDLGEFDDSKLALDDIEDPIAPVEDVLEEEIKEETKVELKETTTTPVVKPNSNFKFTPIVFDKTATTEATPVAAPVVEEKKADKPKLPVIPPKVTDDAERALERAKRFGIQLNDTAKKDIRAQRFGIPATSVSPKPTSPKAAKSTPVKAASKGIDPEVLKKRAERFGLAKTATEKKTPVVKGKVPVSLDPAEEEKKRKRAERFQQSEDAKKQKTE